MTDHTESETEIELDSNGNGGFPFFAIGFFVLMMVATGVLYWLRQSPGGQVIELCFILCSATAISMVIWQACDPFADAAQWVGRKMRLPSSVRGATLDAIASSMPELFTGLFFVMVALSGDKNSAQRLVESAEGYGSTIATCAGSSIYNLILIPAVCAIAISFSRKKRPHIEVSREVIYREGGWLVATQIGLLIFLFQPKLHWWMGLAMLIAYAAYVFHLYYDTAKFRRKLESGQLEDDDEIIESAGVFFGCFDVSLNAVTSTIVLVVSTAVAAAACYFLVELTNESAGILGVPPFFVAVILTAAVSSIPDTFVSLGSAKRGDDSGAMSNVFGSNIFDICIGMSIPLVVLCWLNDGQPVVLSGADGKTLRGVIGLRVFLFVLTAIAMIIMWQRRKITRRMGWVFCGLYGSFVLYAILGAMDIIPV